MLGWSICIRILDFFPQSLGRFLRKAMKQCLVFGVWSAYQVLIIERRKWGKLGCSELQLEHQPCVETWAINCVTEEKLTCNTTVVVVENETPHASPAHCILWSNEHIPCPDVCMYYLVVKIARNDFYSVWQDCKRVGTKQICEKDLLSAAISYKFYHIHLP